MAQLLGEYWGAISNEECHVDAEMLERVLACVPQVAWPSEPLLDPPMVKELLRSAPPSSPGPDGIRYAHLLSLGDDLFELCSSLFKDWVCKGVWLESFNVNWVVPISKVELSTPRASQIRPISLSSTISNAADGPSDEMAL